MKKSWQAGEQFQQDCFVVTVSFTMYLFFTCTYRREIPHPCENHIPYLAGVKKSFLSLPCHAGSCHAATRTATCAAGDAHPSPWTEL